MMGYDFYGIFGGLGMGLGMILWIPLVGLVVWALARLVWRPNQKDELPLDLLRRRYARGEINDAEFERAKQGLA
jgi:putative membrane protein